LSLSSSSLETAASGTQEKCLPLLPSGPDGIHIHLLRRAVPRLQKDRMAETAGFEPTAPRLYWLCQALGDGLDVSCPVILHLPESINDPYFSIYLS